MGQICLEMIIKNGISAESGVSDLRDPNKERKSLKGVEKNVNVEKIGVM